MDSFSVICIEDGGRPESIPSTTWVKKGTKYTVIEVAKMRIQNGILGFKLAEINIDSCFPYQYFSATRFGLPIQIKSNETEAMLEKLLEEAKKEAIEEPLIA